MPPPLRYISLICMILIRITKISYQKNCICCIVVSENTSIFYVKITPTDFRFFHRLCFMNILWKYKCMKVRLSFRKDFNPAQESELNLSKIRTQFSPQNCNFSQTALGWNSIRWTWMFLFFLPNISLNYFEMIYD